MSTPAWRGEGRSAGIPIPAALALAYLMGGCGAPATPPAKTAASDAATPIRLAWLPVEALAAPEVAGAANSALARLRPAGVTASAKAPVSMEVAQLTIECIQPTAACYSAVGRSIDADRLLWLEIARSTPDGKAVRVAVAFYDVQAGAFLRRAERTFASTAEARTGIQPFVAEAVPSP
jgi:hypothetical protein